MTGSGRCDLIPRLLLLWFNLVPFFKRGSEFQVHPDGSVSVRRGDSWEPLLEYQYSAVTADGTTVEFTRPPDGPPEMVLPQDQVFSREYGARLPSKVSASSSGDRWLAGASPSRVRHPEVASPHAESDGRPVGQTGHVQLISIDDIRVAADLIRPYVLRTPLVPAGWADDERPLWIKPENLQSIGAFKVRGAFNAIGHLDESVRTRGVVAYSSGNHAQAVAYAAAVYGVPAHIVMPEETPNIKVAATRSHGAEVVLCGAGQREKVAAEVVAATGGVLVPPFDHPDIIAGQGTIGLEIAEDLPTVENVLVPVSGGGLASGIGTAIKALCPDARVFGVEPELAADTAEGLRLGHRVDWTIEDRNRTIADGLRSQPSELTFAHLQKVLDGVITVSENEIRAAMRELAYRAHLVAEPSGAVAMAAYRKGATPPGRTVVILSGGNIEPPILQQILAG